MIIQLKDLHKLHLLLLQEQTANVVQDFCKLALEYISKGSNTKLYASAAQKLNVAVQDIQNAVEGLVYLLTESCKHKLNELDFRDTVLTAGFSEEQESVLSTFYESKQKEINEVLNSKTFNIPHFKDLEWRFEAQVSSRAMVNQMTPQVTMKLALESTNGIENILLQTDPKNLVHMTEVLEAAYQEARSQNTRRVQRKLKIK